MPTLIGSPDYFSRSILQKDSLKTSVTQKAVSYLGSNTSFNRLNLLNNQFASIQKQLFASPLKILESEASYNGQVNSLLLDSGKSYAVNQFYISQSLSLYQIPVNVSYRFQDYATPLYPAVNNFSSDFDKEAFLASMQKKLVGKFNPEELVSDLPGTIDNAKAAAAKTFSNEISGLKSKYGDIVKKYQQQLGDPQTLITKDTKGLRQELMKNYSPGAIETKRNLFDQLQTRVNNGEQVDRALLDRLKTEISELELIDELIRKVDAQKQQWQQSGLIKKISENELAKKVKINEIANAPATIKKLAREKLNLTSIQKIFLNINKLSLGQGVANQSALSSNHYLLNGINTEFLNQGNTYLGLMFGTHNDFNSLPDRIFSNFQQASSNLSTGLKFGKGDPSGAHSHVSFNTFKIGSQQNSYGLPSVSARTVSVFGLDNRVDIGKGGYINFEVSKSTSKFEMGASPPDSFQQNKSAVNALFSGENFYQNLALNVDYQNYYKTLDLDHRMFIRYVGTAYYNPGNYFLPSGGKETGTQLKKSFFRKKLVANLRHNLREYKFSENGDQRWLNSSATVDLRWKMRRGEYLGIRYQPTKMTRSQAEIKTLMSRSNRLSAEISMNKKLFTKPYRNYLSVSFLENFYTVSDSSTIQSNAILLNSFQSYQIKTYSLFWNLSYNMADNRSQYVFFNSALNSDIGLSYAFLKTMTASSSLTYSKVKSWYEQAGLRQTLSGQLKENISFNFYIDARVNLKEYQQYYQDLIRAEWGIKYHFKQMGK